MPIAPKRPALAAPLLLALGLAPAVAAAQDWGRQAGTDVDVSLDFHRYDTTLESEGADWDTRYTKLGMSFFETNYGRLRPGLLLGWLEFRQSGNPATDGLVPSGGYLGIRLEYLLVDARRFGLGVAGDYVYHAASEVELDSATDEVTNKVNMEWSESTLGAWAELRLGRIDLIGSAAYLRVVGDETVREPDALSGTRRFESADDLTGYAGLRVWTDPTGRLEALGNAGAREGITLRFARAF